MVGILPSSNTSKTISSGRRSENGDDRQQTTQAVQQGEEGARHPPRNRRGRNVAQDSDFTVSQYHRIQGVESMSELSEWKHREGVARLQINDLKAENNRLRSLLAYFTKYGELIE